MPRRPRLILPNNPRFADQIAVALGRRVTPGKSRRPRKLPVAESGKSLA